MVLRCLHFYRVSKFRSFLDSKPLVIESELLTIRLDKGFGLQRGVNTTNVDRPPFDLMLRLALKDLVEGIKSFVTSD